jgi:trans-aconitate 2-methyltransferase
MTEPRDTWSPDQYERFRDERSRPFFDLTGLVQKREHMRVVDLGCGTGELTRKLHEGIPGARTLGIDSSEAMLAKCAAHVTEGLSFEAGDIASLAAAWSEAGGLGVSLKGPGPSFDLVFSNAAIHWVPDHETLLARLTKALRPGGQLAVQIPANEDHPAHVVARQLAAEDPFAKALGGWTHREPVHAPERYATWLHRLGYVEQSVRLQVYGHVLESREGVLEWVKGTLLTDYERRLGPALYPTFLARYRVRLGEALEDRRPYFYPFKRILFWGRLGA